MPDFIHNAYRKVKRDVRITKVWAVGIGKNVEKKALFESFCGKAYTDNPCAISEALNNLAPEIKIVWALNGKVNENLDSCQ